MSPTSERLQNVVDSKSQPSLDERGARTRSLAPCRYPIACSGLFERGAPQNLFALQASDCSVLDCDKECYANG